MTHPSLDWDKLGRYLAGESSPDEAAAMRRWLEEHPSDAKVIAALNEATRNVGTGRPLDIESALRKVKTRPAAKTPARFAALVRRFETYAAAAAILLVAGLYLTRRGPTDSAPAAAPRTYATLVGQRDSVVLADGTRILIGPGSRVVVRDREVDLEGQAFFTVVKNPRRPFTVRAGGAVIRDIGTEFSVHSDPAEPMRVVVTEGSVALTRGRDSVTLQPGDVGIVAVGTVTASRGAATPDDMAWTSGRLVFRNASVSELVADLRRWYGVELRVSDSALLRRHFTGSFVREPPARVLDVIALALGARAERRGDTVFIKALPRR